MRHAFYDSPKYKKKQSATTAANWLLGIHNKQRKAEEKRICKNIDCSQSFNVKPYDIKQFCSLPCAAVYNNKTRGPHSVETRQKVAKALTGRISPNRGKILVQRLQKNCLFCEKEFLRNDGKITNIAASHVLYKTLGVGKHLRGQLGLNREFVKILILQSIFIVGGKQISPAH